jgi:hypothetical protein
LASSFHTTSTGPGAATLTESVGAIGAVGHLVFGSAQCETYGAGTLTNMTVSGATALAAYTEEAAYPEAAIGFDYVGASAGITATLTGATFFDGVATQNGAPYFDIMAIEYSGAVVAARVPRNPAVNLEGLAVV